MERKQSLDVSLYPQRLEAATLDVHGRCDENATS